MLTLQVGEGLSIPALETEPTLPFAELWDEDAEEEVGSLSMIDAREKIIAEDGSPTMGEVFSDLHPEGHQTSSASSSRGR